MHLSQLRLPLVAALAALSLALPGACSAAPPPRQAPSPDDAVEVVVAISVDGLNPDAIRRLGRGGAPGIHRMLTRGVGTLNARTEHELTRTLPNHTGMLTGRPVAGADGHQVTFNEDNGSILPAVAGEYVAGVFDVVHDHGGSTAFYSAKDKLDFLDRSWDAAHGAPDRAGADDGRDKVDRYVVDTEAANVGRLLGRLRRHPDTFSFVHLAQPDTAGHTSGFMSGAYLDAVRAVDRQVARILATVRADPDLAARTTVLLTADHGGLGASHSDPTKPANFRVPFVVWGVGTARGADLYALNEGRRARPGAHRTTYAGTQPVRNGEVANVVTDLLDLPQVPGSVIGQPPLLLRAP